MARGRTFDQIVADLLAGARVQAATQDVELVHPWDLLSLDGRIRHEAERRCFKEGYPLSEDAPRLTEGDCRD